MDSSGAVGLDESPSQPPSSPLPPPRTPRGLFFRSPAEEETEAEPLSLPAEADDVAGSASELPWSESDEWSDDELPTSTASPAGDKPLQLASKAQMRQTARTAVKIGTGVAHTVAARTEVEQQIGLYLADDDDAAAIGDPLADIAYRRGDVLGGKLSPDANDLMRSVFGVVGYFTKQVAKIGEVRRYQAAQAAGEVQSFPGGEG